MQIGRKNLTSETDDYERQVGNLLPATRQVSGRRIGSRPRRLLATLSSARCSSQSDLERETKKYTRKQVKNKNLLKSVFWVSRYHLMDARPIHQPPGGAPPGGEISEKWQISLKITFTGFPHEHFHFLSSPCQRYYSTISLSLPHSLDLHVTVTLSHALYLSSSLSLSLSPSFSLSLCLYHTLSTCLYVSLSLYLSLCLSLTLSLYLSPIYVSLILYTSISISLSLSLFLYLSISSSLSLSHSPSISLFSFF